MRSRAWLNGVEVTRRCFYADSRRGIVRLYKLNAEGRKYVNQYPDDMRPATETLKGRVVIRRQR